MNDKYWEKVQLARSVLKRSDSKINAIEDAKEAKNENNQNYLEKIERCRNINKNNERSKA